MPTLLSRIVPFVLLTAVAAAQLNITVPASLNGVEGGSGSNVPFGTNVPARFQCIYEAADLPWVGPRVITGISLRADNSNGGTIAQKGFVVVNVVMSTTSVSPSNASATFEDNWGADAVYVINNQPLTLPPQQAVTGVRPCNIDFVFQRQWAYGLTPARHGETAPPANLLIEIQIISQPAGTYRLDNFGSCQSPPVQFGNTGPACAAAGQQPLELVPGASMQTGSQFAWTIRNAEPNVLAMLAINLTSQGTFLGQALPVALFDPTNPALPPPALSAAFRFGAPDCWLNLTPAVTFVAIADTAGIATISTRIASSRFLVGQSICAQALAYSQTANQLLFTTSLGQQSTVCGPLSVARLYNLGSATAAGGQLGLGQGAIFEVR